MPPRLAIITLDIGYSPKWGIIINYWVNSNYWECSWTPGQSIGTNGEGIINPVEVVVRDKRRGLGA